ncbi:hypothetical protein GCM10018784_67570 [Streptomyces hydrogenans]|nr:hypothetical protein GCM10018784_67570 [Streptomyces hydrogenans]
MRRASRHGHTSGATTSTPVSALTRRPPAPDEGLRTALRNPVIDVGVSRPAERHCIQD